MSLPLIGSGTKTERRLLQRAFGRALLMVALAALGASACAEEEDKPFDLGVGEGGGPPIPPNPNNDPGNNDPGNNDPGNNDPGNNDPGNNDPGNNDPGNNDPGNNDPGNNDTPLPTLPASELIFIEESIGNDALAGFMALDAVGNMPRLLTPVTNAQGTFVNVESGNADLNDTRNQIAYVPRGGAPNILITDLEGATVQAIVEGGIDFSQIRSPQFRTDGSAVLFVGGEANGIGDLTASGVFEVPSEGGNAVPMVMEKASCAVIRDLRVIGADKLLAVRDVCEQFSDSGFFEFTISTGAATPIMVLSRSALDFTLGQATLAADGQTIIASGSGSFDRDFDEAADLNGNGIFIIDPENPLTTTIHRLASPNDVAASFALTQLPDTVIIEVFAGGTNNLVRLNTTTGQFTPITTNGKSRSPF